MKLICNGVKGLLGFYRKGIDTVVNLGCGAPKPRASKEKGEFILGGLASSMPPGSVIESCVEKGFGMEQMELELQRGIDVEMEHVIGMEDQDKARAIAEEIALDHLMEHCNYYEGLDAMEQDLKSQRERWA